MLRLNFFTTWIPEDPICLLARDLAEGERPRLFERRLSLAREEVGRNPVLESLDRENKAVFVAFTKAQASADYLELAVRARELAPHLVHALTSEGLHIALQAAGMVIERDPVGFSCFDPDLLQESPAPDLVQIRRGVQFRSDFVGVGRGRAYGYFVSSTSRLKFVRELFEDEALCQAAQGERVGVVEEGDTLGMTLKSFNFREQTAVVTRDAVEQTVGLQRVQARATAGTLRRYLQEDARPERARAVRLASQLANFRLQRNGQRDRRWLAKQFEFVSSWLVSKSESGRLKFKWPGTRIELYVATDALRISR